MSQKLLLALALSLGLGVNAWADAIPTVVNSASGGGTDVWTITVFNDSGRTINSGEIAVWDTSDSDVHSSRLRYVTRSATADDIWTAGVMANTCLDQTQCELIVYGITLVRCMDAADAVGINTTVGNSASGGDQFGGKCGDFVPGANARSLGVAITAGGGTDYEYMPVFVDTLGAPAEQ